MSLPVGAAPAPLLDRFGFGVSRIVPAGMLQNKCANRARRKRPSLLTNGNHMVTLLVTIWFLLNANIATLYFGR